MDFNLPDRVGFRRLKLLEDKRGSLIKILMHQHLPTEKTEFGEIYLTHANPDGIRGSHYHKMTTEWFCVIHGSFIMQLQDLYQSESKIYTNRVYAERPVIITVPPGIAHAFINPGPGHATLLAYADRPYNPEDTDTYSWQPPADMQASETI